MKLALLLFPAILSAQDLEKTFTFEQAQTGKQAKDLSAAVATIGQMKIDAGENSVTVKGTQAQLDFAAWAIAKLDIEPAVPLQHSTIADYPFQGDKVRIFHVAKAPTLQAFLEMATAMRSATQIRHLYALDWNRTWIARGSPVDLDAAEWVWNQLDRPTPQRTVQTYKRAIPSTPTQDDLQDTFVILPVIRPASVQEFQEVSTAVRSLTELRFVFTYGFSNTIVARMPAFKVEMVTWLVHQLDLEPASKITPSFSVPALDEAINIVYLPASYSVSDFRAEAVRIRTAAGIRWFYAFNRDRALLIRGTAAQLAHAHQLLADTKK